MYRALYRSPLLTYVSAAIVILASSATADDLLSDTDPSPVASPFAFAMTIDQLLEASWVAAEVTPTPICNDSQFVRRIYLDLLGRVPRVSETREFLASSAPERREQLIDRLVAHPTYATRMTNLWRLFLLPAEESDVMRFASSAGFEAWLRQRFAENAGYQEIARELLTAEGEADDAGPALFYTAWDLKPEKLAGSTARALLGIQIECAECHDHPFDRWSQKDFWSYAAFFARLQPSANEAGRAFREGLNGEVSLPDTTDPIPPRLLGEELPEQTNLTRRQILAEWITAPDNPYFAAATVNRVWFLLFGRGLVDPPDDMGSHNPTPHQELLDRLAASFVEHHFDLKWLVKTLCRTRAYQLDIGATDTESTRLFAHMAVKVMTAEQLYDSLRVAVCEPHQASTGGPTFGLNRLQDRDRSRFLAHFRSPSVAVADYRLGVAQALTLLNGPMMDAETQVDRSTLIGSLDAPFLEPRQCIEILYLATLSRFPTDAEWNVIATQLDQCEDKLLQKELYSDLLWALLNSGEFVLNR